MSIEPHRPAPNPRRAVACLAGVLAGVLVLWVATAPGQDLQSQLDAKQAQLGEVRQQQGVLSSEIAS
jgi:ferric-dicitrate binding protein FerR (iron transport regulator)